MAETVAVADAVTVAVSVAVSVTVPVAVTVPVTGKVPGKVPAALTGPVKQQTTRGERQMKQLTTTLLLLLSFALPVYADEFDDALAEIRALLDQCNDAHASQQACLDDTGRVSMSVQQFADNTIDAMPQSILLDLYDVLLEIRGIVKANTVRIEALEAGRVASKSEVIQIEVKESNGLKYSKDMNRNELFQYNYERRLRRGMSPAEAEKWAHYATERALESRAQRANPRQFTPVRDQSPTRGTISDSERSRRELQKFVEDKSNNSAAGKRLP